MLLLWACVAPSSDGVGVAPHVLVNEVVARNESTWQEGGAFPDWIELYNAGDTEVALADLVLSDGDGTWRGGDGVLAPGGHYLVAADGAFGAPFRLRGDETLTLGTAGAVLDRVTLPGLHADVAWARHPDGGAPAETVWATPGAPNPDTPSPTTDPSDTAFGQVLHEIAITLDPAAEASLRADRFGWVEAAVTLDGLRYAPVQVRLKSLFGSRRELDEKPGFKIKLDGLADFQWRGLENLTLNNMVQDPSYVHEALAYTLYRESGVPAPRVAWAHVTVNDEDHGVSLLVETVDTRFLARWYDDPTGVLYEGAAGVDLYAGMEDKFEYDEGPDPADRSDLTALVTALEQPTDDAGVAGVEALVDMDELLTHAAVEAVAQHWDGYRNPNNYRLYHDPTTDRFAMLPWGADEALARVTTDPWSGRGRLTTYCLANPSCRARFDAKLVEVADRADALGLSAEALTLAEWLRPAIEADPRREFDMERHDQAVGETVRLLDSWPDQVRGLVGGTP